MSDSSLLIFTLGPIQDFIASARRCRDLWFGSWLLSSVSRRVAVTIEGICGTDALIFPGGMNPDDDEPVANRIVAIVDQDRVSEVAQACVHACTAALEEQAEALLRHRSTGFRWLPEANDETVRAQLSDLLETFWVALPSSARSGPAYQAARERAEELMAARKHIRNWSPSSWGSDAPKSSLDGFREAVAELPRGQGASEYLCAVGLLKRRGVRAGGNGDEPYPLFHSSSHVAAAPCFAVFEEQGVRDAFDEYLDALDRVGEELGLDRRVSDELRVDHAAGPRGERHPERLDGAILFETRVIDCLEELHQQPLDAAHRRTVVRHATEFKRRAGLPLEINPYYALVLADGDRMGRLISRQPGFDEHRKLSMALGEFAVRASAITKGHSGSLIYSGGDDVLALVPIYQVLPYARCLADEFRTRLSGFGDASLSVGVAIAHHLVHFGTVRAQAKRAEGLAKEQRNSLAILLDKRSGGTRMVAGCWDDRPAPLDRRLAHWIQLLSGEDMPHGFIRELEDLALFAEGCADATALQELDAVLQHELERIMSRKRADPDARDLGLDEDLRTLLRTSLQDPARGPSSTARVRALASELTVSLEILRATHSVELRNARTQEATA